MRLLSFFLFLILSIAAHPRDVIDCIHSYIQTTYVNLSVEEYGNKVREIVEQIPLGEAPLKVTNCIEIMSTS